MKLIKIPEDKYHEYRLQAMFHCYKWDPQFCDNNTLAKYVLVLSKEEDEQITKLTKDLDVETRLAEEYLNKHIKIAKKLSLPKKIFKKISSMQYYDSTKNIRLMRYDFHLDINNRWFVTEVNSDVPGGFAESSLLPEIARKIINMPELKYISFGEKMVEAINKKLNKVGNIMLVHCTCFSDDRQVMQYMGDRLKMEGYNIIYGAADHISFKNGQAYCILDNNKEKIDLIFRFTPLEWLVQMKPRKWDGYFDTVTCSCNHPIAIYAQSKRFPFVWDDLEKAHISMKIWKSMLPETLEVNMKGIEQGFIYKPVYGRVGEKISIKEACKENEYSKIIRDVKKYPNHYIMQKKFDSFPVVGEGGETYHICLGSYTIDGEHAGYYARMSEYPRIDSYAADIPVLIEKRR